MTKKQVTTALLTILIIASFLRLYNLMPMDNTGSFSPPGLYPDEAMNGNNAMEALSTGSWKIFYQENFGREGLFINIQSLSIKAFGNNPWALRLPSAIFGILTVLGIYFLAKELYASENLALFSSFLLATSFWHINFSRIGFRAIMAPAFLTWGVYFFLKTLKNNSQIPIFNSQKKWASDIGHWALPIFGGLIYGLGFYSYIAYRTTSLLMLVIAYLFFKKYRAENRLFPYREFSVFTAVAILAALPIGIYFLNHPADFFGRTTGISVFNSATPLFDLAFNVVKTLGMFNIAGDFNWRHNLAGSPELSLPIGIFFLYGIYLAIRKIRREKFDAVPELTLFGWFAIVMLPVVISNEGLPHALRAILMIPPVFILSASGGLGIHDLFKKHLKPASLRYITCLFLLMLVLEVYISYFTIWSNRTEVKDSFAYQDYLFSQQINSLPLQLNKYIIVHDTQGIIQRDYPISLQSVLFLTDTFSAEKRSEKNIFYITPEQFKNLPKEPDGIVLRL